ncbi:4-hydroxy-3-methylbut-2-enyl diphosphate reductase [Blochmannia endosymbiont of Camponotus sp.]|uniref:4-hydroxy-3-methylbut-2-enyl diphosphate reductase n=1 Tax=Blochmannia endosymbiont of Camponotus sp. TaxID=700220 RepID=UPI002023BE6A|nr:4-hydroxy-3-methylbut-2-enyl diphosphate reductase [Blochmannia endosymbiont of Camponotus sp.]URJ24207.1 4-hydroxy-3-methylbut-2-enyl diphosphate reductase [Blochmannia endosymbiont of Camponotus sp.]URJ26050.1 4-hydroxy-3-methylbut-2-enyl diphosphate reductase [Blochmannia endosymbiont of Camponotus sp.]
MRVILANPRGFCAGVKRAINIVEKTIQVYGTPIYVRHELVHNDYVVTQLSKKGVIFIERPDEAPNGSVLIFSAHGVSKKIREQAKIKNLIIIDATCPLVTKVHREVSRANRNNMEVILIGHSSHPEVEGTMGQYISTNSRQKIYLVGSQSDAWSIQVNYPNHLFFVTQTTLSIDDTAEIIAILHKRFPNIMGPRKNDICYATFNRQNALKNLALMVEMIFVVGSITSSNSVRLMELARRIGKIAYLISHANDIQKNWLRGVNNIGITAGASAPDILVLQVIEKLRVLSADHVVVEEMIGEEENVFFDTPKI